jgi:hypothetical protein
LEGQIDEKIDSEKVSSFDGTKKRKNENEENNPKASIKKIREHSLNQRYQRSNKRTKQFKPSTRLIKCKE